MQPEKNNKPKSNGQKTRGSNNANKNGKNQKGGSKPIASNLTTSRGQAVRAQRRSQQDAMRIANQYVAADASQKPKQRANVIDDSPRLKVIGLGGMDGGS